MFYAKQTDDNSDIVALHCFESDVFPTIPYFVEITEEEYNTLLVEMQPSEPTDKISDSEALAIILGEVEV